MNISTRVVARFPAPVLTCGGASCKHQGRRFSFRVFRPEHGRRIGLTLIELIVAMSIFSFVAAGMFRALQVFAGKTSENLSNRLVLQMEARRAFLTMFQRIQQGIEIVLPSPGSTMPYLVFRDFLNNVRIVYLKKDEKVSKQEGEDMYTALEGIKETGSKKAEKPVVLMRYVKSLNFTAHHYGGVLVSCTLKSGKGQFSLVNYVRLKNMTAED